MIARAPLQKDISRTLRGQTDRLSTPRLRIYVLAALFAGLYLTIAGRLVAIALNPAEKPLYTAATSASKTRHRPNIVDRNGTLLASDIYMQSLVADPKKILHVDEAIEKILEVLPTLDRQVLRRQLEDKSSRFAWIKRGLTPAEATKLHNLGLPGFRFTEEPRRVYPAGPTASHVLGFVDVDNRGRAGIEAYVDKIQGIYFPKLKGAGEKPPLQLSIDLGVQHVLRQKIASAMTKHRALAGAGILLHIETGEVVAMSSLPDYDPNHPREALKKNRFDRNTSGNFELGSVFKAFTIAMALEIGGASLKDNFDARAPIRSGKFKIRDYHPQNRILTLEEVFTFSSNIGSARLANLVGPEKHRDFLGAMGLLGPMKTELGLTRVPQAPRQWRALRSMTISYGHGIALTPLQFASAAASLFNDGRQITPTFLKRSGHGKTSLGQRILSAKTSATLRDLMRLNVTKGTGKNAKVKGYQVGGKTGTAEKVIGGVYAKDRLLNSFLAIFPSDKPAYLLFVLLDEPQADENKPKQRPTAGVTAAPLAGDIIAQVAPILGLVPVHNR